MFTDGVAAAPDAIGSRFSFAEPEDADAAGGGTSGLDTPVIVITGGGSTLVMVPAQASGMSPSAQTMRSACLILVI
jgi:hypothetical protein